jgi:hypothetical protein
MNSEIHENKIVHVNGVQFDISSILNDVTLSIQNNIKKSLDGALKDYEVYKSTHDAIMQIPFVRDLYTQNQELISKLETMDQQLHSQSIQLEINEITPQSSPVVMHSYVQMEPHDVIKNANQKLSTNSSYDGIDEFSNTNKDSSEHDEESSEEHEESSEEHETSSEEDETSSEDHEDASEQEKSSDEEEADEEADEEAEQEADEEADEEEAKQEADEEEEAEQEEADDEEADDEEADEEEADEEEADDEEADEDEEAEDEEDEEAEEAEDEEEEQEEQEEQEEEEVYEITIKNVTYFTTNEESGDIYECVDGDVGEIVGKFKNKKPVFLKRK